MGSIISRLPISARVERSRDTVRPGTTDGHLDFARCERGLIAFTESPNAAGPVAGVGATDVLRKVHPLQPRPAARHGEQLVDVELALGAMRDHPVRRSEKRRGGKECVRKCRPRGSPYHKKKKQKK